ncbi:hypothetical protein MMC09_002279 [Bachmanniomyces sp. S44760]|nr:hypothetical protein [Bachmanniomyces sp. S44760]
MARENQAVATGPMVAVIDFVNKLHHDTYPFIHPSNYNLSGRNVFITGASKGIGRSTALSFARAGASGIALAARSSLSSLIDDMKTAAKDAGRPEPKIHTYAMDVSDRAAIERIAAQVDKDFSGRLDILINNAGYLEEFVPITESDPDEWWKTWEVNLRGTYLVTRSFLPLMLKSGAKTIINMSSVGAHRTRPGASSYQTGKMAVCRFTEFINSEYGEQGIIAIAIHPGGVMTELASRMPKYTHGILVDTPGLAADSIIYLTAERKEWLAGRYISVNWDMEEFEGKKEEIIKGDLLKFRMAM